jgi:hypothetical protein
MRRIAIVGSGPSGCYLAEALLRGDEECRIDIVDRLPTPFGLVRFGVAPDHQSTKAVTRLLDRVLAKPDVSFFGGVEVGRDISLDELRERYDTVVIATGASRDRRLDIPGEDLPGVFGSGKFVGWYTHHPDHADLDLREVDAAAVIGNGNVALDVARMLAKRETELHGSDLDPDVERSIANSGIRNIAIVGRRPAEFMKFSERELGEFGDLQSARPHLGVPHDVDGVAGNAAETLRDICARTYEGERIDVTFSFGLTPVAFEGAGRLEGVRFVSARGDEIVVPAGLAVTCIGYESTGHGLPLESGSIANSDGRIGADLYVVGWAKRGPSGTIPTNRAEAQAVAKTILADGASSEKPGTPALIGLLRARAREHIDYAGWRRIDASEIARAGASRVRRKWRSHDELLAASRR